MTLCVVELDEEGRGERIGSLPGGPVSHPGSGFQDLHTQKGPG